MDIYESHVEGIVDAVEFSPSRVSEVWQYRFQVPEHAAGLVVAIGHAEGDRFQLPESARLRLVYLGADDEQEINDELASDEASVATADHDLVSFMSSRPAAGEWLLHITHSRPEPFAVHLLVLRRPLWELRGFVARRRCKACKVTICAILYALLAKMTAGDARVMDIDDFAARLARLPVAALDFLTRVFGVSPDLLRDYLARCVVFFELENPFDRLVRRVCEFLGLCAPREAVAY